MTEEHTQRIIEYGASVQEQEIRSDDDDLCSAEETPRHGSATLQRRRFEASVQHIKLRDRQREAGNNESTFDFVLSHVAMIEPTPQRIIVLRVLTLCLLMALAGALGFVVYDLSYSAERDQFLATYDAASIQLATELQV